MSKDPGRNWPNRARQLLLSQPARTRLFICGLCKTAMGNTPVAIVGISATLSRVLDDALSTCLLSRGAVTLSLALVPVEVAGEGGVELSEGAV